MKEILYIQAGELSNYTGTHFWNTQESYLALDEDYTEVDSGVSFCENVDDKVSCAISHPVRLYIFSFIAHRAGPHYVLA
jgi:hypothetical protein